LIQSSLTTPLAGSTALKVIQLAVMLSARYPLSPRNVEDLASERGIDICHEVARKWVSRGSGNLTFTVRSNFV
jgi:transposase-like protein